MVVNHEKLKEVLVQIAKNAGANDYESEILADSIVDAELRGMSSHGLVRYPSYMNRIKQGMYATDVEPVVEKDEGAMVLLDAQNGLGAPMAMKAMEVAIERAAKYGISLVGMNHANHFGCGSYYTQYAAQKGMISFIIANANAWVAPYGGAKKKLGTNPLGFAIPNGDKSPFLVDMATSEAAQGKVVVASKKGISVPPTWGVDANGNPCTDPNAILQGGALMPFGGPKGYGISLAIELLCSALAGGCRSTQMGSMFDTEKLVGTGFLFCVIDVSKMVDPAVFADRVQEIFDDMKDAGTPEREVLIPGEIEERKAAIAKVQGIEVADAVFADLEKLAAEYGVSASGLAM